MLSSRVKERIWPGRPHRWRDVPGRLRPAVISVGRSTVAAVIAYGLELAAGESKLGIDLTGSLTAILVLQATAVSTLRMGLVRVGAVLSGVLIATVISSYAGLTWWSLGITIAAALTAARIFRLAPQTPEAAISAMLILGVTGHQVAAEIRVLNTFIGAGVGVAMGLLLPTAVGTADVIGSVRRAAEAAAEPLHKAGSDFAEAAPDRSQAQGWLDRARGSARQMAEATRGVHDLRERRQFNTRALGTTDVVPVLDSAVDTLDRCLLAIRAFFTTISASLPENASVPEDNDSTGADHPHRTAQPEDTNRADTDQPNDTDQPDDTDQPEDTQIDPLGPDLRQALAVVLEQIADSLLAFGDLVVAEAEGREQQAEQALQSSLEYARETRAMVSDLLLVNPSDSPSWLQRGSALTALQQILDNLRLENREQARQERKRQRLPAAVAGALPHPERPYPRAVDQVLDRRRIVRAQQDRPRPALQPVSSGLRRAGRLATKRPVSKLARTGRLLLESGRQLRARHRDHGRGE